MARHILDGSPTVKDPRNRLVGRQYAPSLLFTFDEFERLTAPAFRWKSDVAPGEHQRNKERTFGGGGGRGQGREQKESDAYAYRSIFLMRELKKSSLLVAGSCYGNPLAVVPDPTAVFCAISASGAIDNDFVAVGLRYRCSLIVQSIVVVCDDEVFGVDHAAPWCAKRT